ncbi:Uncharacterised protein [Mycobacterium tuberculosis]|nr:Uncharacterised protein [Mycobacterium tuberculosis]
MQWPGLDLWLSFCPGGAGASPLGALATNVASAGRAGRCPHRPGTHGYSWSHAAMQAELLAAHTAAGGRACSRARLFGPAVIADAA